MRILLVVAALAAGVAIAWSVGSASELPSQEIGVTTTGAWDCFYEPTINDDWHDDVFCTNGVDSARPILLPDQGFVTEAEMIAAGEAYEVSLNS